MSNWSRIYIRLKVNFRLQFPTIHNFSGWVCSVARDRYFQFHNCKNGQRLGGYSCPAWCTGKFNQEPHYFKKCEFSHQKKVFIFCHLNRKCATKGLAVLEFFSELSLSIKKLTPKKMAGNLNCLEYWYSYLSKKNLFLKIIYLYSPFL